MKVAIVLLAALVIGLSPTELKAQDDVAERRALAKAVVSVSTIASMKAGQSRGLRRGLRSSLGARATPYALSEADLALEAVLARRFASLPEQLEAAYAQGLTMRELREIRGFQTDPVSRKLAPVLPAIQATESPAEKVRLLNSVLTPAEQERLAEMANSPANDKLISITQDLGTRTAASIDADVLLRELRKRCPGKKERLPWC